jgi:hypothetical protein
LLHDVLPLTAVQWRLRDRPAGRPSGRSPQRGLRRVSACIDIGSFPSRYRRCHRVQAGIISETYRTAVASGSTDRAGFCPVSLGLL